MADFTLPDIPEESRRILERVVPPPNRPPLLYLAMSANPAVLRAYAEGPILGLRGLLHTGQLDPADRELTILRITGQCGAEHEWGVHVAYFGKTSGLTESQVRATVTDEDPIPGWTSRQRAVIAVCDAMSAQRALTEEEWALVDAELTDAERTEFVSVAAQYLGIAATCVLLCIPAEPGAPRMPSKEDRPDSGTEGA